MVIQHNMSALNATRMLSISQTNLKKDSEKLSSGYRINRSADDAAGLSISEKMRKQIRGLTQASLNAEDGISLVQVADGALAEVHEMLQRMNELAVHAANGILSTDDRVKLNDEFYELITEIDRVSETTKFNETYILKGDSSGTRTVTLNALAGGMAGHFMDRDGISGDTIARDPSYATASFLLDEMKVGETYNISGENWLIIDTGPNDYGTLEQRNNHQISLYEAYHRMTALDASIEGHNFSQFGDTSSSLFFSGNTVTLEIGKSRVKTNKNLNLALHVGADADMTNKIIVNLPPVNADYLGIGGDFIRQHKDALYRDSCLATDLNDPVNGTYEAGSSGYRATLVLSRVDDAIRTVSKIRSNLGAIQNRLEHTVKNLDNVVENTTASESRIRDTDMAKEMVNFSNHNILQQAGQSILGQANQSNQGVLSLLQ